MTNYFEITKAALSLIVVIGSLVLAYLAFAGAIQPTPEASAIVGYLLAEARVILMTYFKQP